MKRIGIITIYDRNGNFGNKLQNYAVLKTFEKMGCKCNTIATEPEIKITEIIKDDIIYFVRGIIKRKPFAHSKSYRRILNYRRFNSLLNVDYSLIEKNKLEDYDVLSVGSDQVWNPNYYIYKKNRKDYYLLNFNTKAKKISLCASFGVSELPIEWKEWFEEKLKQFNCISVREYDGAKIIKGLTGIDVNVLIDPTMMLSREEWKIISCDAKINPPKKPYILTYFLGSKNSRAFSMINDINCESKYDVINLLDERQRNVFFSGPKEFIKLIEHSKIVLTDSFHACVFSFLFNKPFLVYKREGNQNQMFGRIKTFLSTFDLERKYIDSNLKNDIWEHDYAVGYKQLESEKEKVMQFLKNALGEE